ncbi:Integrase [Spongiibacter sp. IMCC21906]|uniref:tyrosine-type recombinase/integrase n=1 Tax=Spongiibacter sp. IMCC21906 TaxID=1620392 RepID=UPI00062DF38E|nr:integrase arm-type DNA-binding domain-containing protein [Spongiibacter sp. IMCC21906]AKH67711.1 Integrase [Spongiibacter sp. IMCC21906]
MPLTDPAVKLAKPKDKPYRLTDGEGMYLEVSPKGGKYWRMKYRFGGKEKRLSIGVYPTTSLKKARQLREQARRQLSDGIDPSALKQITKLVSSTAAANSFKVVALEWFAKQKPTWAESHWSKVDRMMERDLFPYLGTRPLNEITPPELLAVLRKIESRGALESAKRTKQIAGQIFRYGVATGRCERDPAQDLNGALATPVKKHFAAITEPKAVGALLNALEGYQGTAVVRAALRIAPLTFVRPGELRKAKWAEIDFDKAEWRYFVTKTKSEHIVPLSTQAIDILRELQPLTCRSEYVFPSARTLSRPMSNNAVLSAMRRMGIDKDEMCGHGFRAMARTILDEELQFRPDWIEHQLAHAVKDVHGRAYNRTAHLTERKKMMQAWANYLDNLKAQAANNNVIAANFG